MSLKILQVAAILTSVLPASFTDAQSLRPIPQNEVSANSWSCHVVTGREGTRLFVQLDGEPMVLPSNSVPNKDWQLEICTDLPTLALLTIGKPPAE